MALQSGIVFSLSNASTLYPVRVTEMITLFEIYYIDEKLQIFVFTPSNVVPAGRIR